MRMNNQPQFQTCPGKQLDIEPHKHRQPSYNKPSKRRRFSRREQDISDYGTIGKETTIDNHIDFKPQYNVVQRRMPAVGDYDISNPIVKPAFETYEKGNNIVLVKINHIGGTSSFSGEDQRFVEGHSIYKGSDTPGPGAYNTLEMSGNGSKRSVKGYCESYNIINQMLKQSRERSQSIPNYIIPSMLSGAKYNGVPKHLQQMYHRLKREKQQNIRPHSLPLGQLLKRKKDAERLPITVDRYTQIQEVDSDQIVPVKRQIRLTETMYRLQDQKRKQVERTKKIRALMDNNNKQSFNQPSKNYFKGKQPIVHKYNKNMVNILYSLRQASPKSKRS